MLDFSRIIKKPIKQVGGPVKPPQGAKPKILPSEGAIVEPKPMPAPVKRKPRYLDSIRKIRPM